MKTISTSDLAIPSFLRRGKGSAPTSTGKAKSDTPKSNVPSSGSGANRGAIIEPKAKGHGVSVDALFKGRILPDVSPAPKTAPAPKGRTVMKKAKPAPKASKPRAVPVTKAVAKKALANVAKSLDGIALVSSPKGKLTLVKPGKSKAELKAAAKLAAVGAVETPASKAFGKAMAEMKARNKSEDKARELSGKSLVIWNLISRKNGATQAELCKATKWGQVSQSPLKPICARMGKTLQFEGRGDDRRYTVR